jgi:hypothetical protein
MAAVSNSLIRYEGTWALKKISAYGIQYLIPFPAICIEKLFMDDYEVFCFLGRLLVDFAFVKHNVITKCIQLGNPIRILNSHSLNRTSCKFLKV